MDPINPCFLNSQFAFYFSQKINRPDNLWFALKSTEVGQLFTEVPVIVPLPDEEEFNEAPAVLVKSNEGHLLKISKKRVDLIFVTQTNNQSYEAQDGFIKKNVSYLHAGVMSFLKENNAVIDRLGFLVNFFYKHEAPEAMVARLLITHPTKMHNGDIQECKIKYATKDIISDIKIHNITSLQGAKIVPHGEVIEETGIKLERDFNTIVGNSDFKFTWETVSKFYSEAEKKFLLTEITQDLWKMKE